MAETFLKISLKFNNGNRQPFGRISHGLRENKIWWFYSPSKRYHSTRIDLWVILISFNHFFSDKIQHQNNDQMRRQACCALTFTLSSRQMWRSPSKIRIPENQQIYPQRVPRYPQCFSDFNRNFCNQKVTSCMPYRPLSFEFFHKSWFLRYISVIPESLRYFGQS
jgi:hypothetical protein